MLSAAGQGLLGDRHSSDLWEILCLGSESRVTGLGTRAGFCPAHCLLPDLLLPCFFSIVDIEFEIIRYLEADFYS